MLESNQPRDSRSRSRRNIDQGATPAGQPVTDFTTLELQREGTTPRWSAALPASTFTGEGNYQILYTAFRDDGFGVDLAAAPLARTVYVGVPPARVIPGAWILYD